MFSKYNWLTPWALSPQPRWSRDLENLVPLEPLIAYQLSLRRISKAYILLQWLPLYLEWHGRLLAMFPDNQKSWTSRHRGFNFSTLLKLGNHVTSSGRRNGHHIQGDAFNRSCFQATLILPRKKGNPCYYRGASRSKLSLCRTVPLERHT